MRENTDQKKTPYLDTFHTVSHMDSMSKAVDFLTHNYGNFRSIPPDVFLGKDVLKRCRKFTGEHPCQSKFIEITLQHGCSPVNLLHIFKIFGVAASETS